MKHFFETTNCKEEKKEEAFKKIVGIFDSSNKREAGVLTIKVYACKDVQISCSCKHDQQQCSTQYLVWEALLQDCSSGIHLCNYCL